MAATTLNIPSPHSVADGIDRCANLQGQAFSASLVSEILTTEEFAVRIRASRETVQAWKKNSILINGRHYLGNGTHVTFPWPLSYVLMMEDKIVLDQETTQLSTGKHPVTANKVPNKTLKRPSKRNESRIGTDF
jgi:hypothetical protein